MCQTLSKFCIDRHSVLSTSNISLESHLEYENQVIAVKHKRIDAKLGTVLDQESFMRQPSVCQLGWICENGCIFAFPISLYCLLSVSLCTGNFALAGSDPVQTDLKIG